MTTESQITISPALTKEERTIAVNFIEENMRKSFGCEPPPTNGVVFTALLNNEIVGTIVLLGTEANTPFPLEEYYNLTNLSSAMTLNRSLIVQGSRWIATHSGASSLLLQRSLSLAYELGKREMLIEAKPYSVKRLAELGIKSELIQGALLQQNKVRALVGEGGMRYFTELPIPALYLINIKQVLSL